MNKVRIEIRLSERCNYNCSYCTDLHNNSVRDTEVDLKGLQNIFDYILEPEIFIYGGEPTLHKQLKELTDFCLIHTEDVIVQTNGSNPDVIKSLDPEVKINYSFHSESISPTEFIKNIKGTNINEISIMDVGDVEDDINFKFYKQLKVLFGQKVQYCPIINSSLTDYSRNQKLVALESSDKWDSIKDDFHFIKHANGVSNYEVWRDNLDSLGRECDIHKHMIHIQNNKVYFCFNQMMMHPEEGISYKEYVYIPDTITCPYQKCYFGMENWVLGA